MKPTYDELLKLLAQRDALAMACKRVADDLEERWGGAAYRSNIMYYVDDLRNAAKEAKP
jgi:hypothetical protein